MQLADDPERVVGYASAMGFQARFLSWCGRQWRKLEGYLRTVDSIAEQNRARTGGMFVPQANLMLEAKRSADENCERIVAVVEKGRTDFASGRIGEKEFVDRLREQRARVLKLHEDWRSDYAAGKIDEFELDEASRRLQETSESIDRAFPHAKP